MVGRIKTVSAVRGDLEVMEVVIAGSGGLKAKVAHVKKEVGRLVPEVSLLSPAFSTALKKLPLDFSKLSGIATIEELISLLIEARRRLGTTTVTRDNWLGKSFEILAPTLPEVQLMEKIVIETFVKVANEAVARGLKASAASGGASHTGFGFMTASYEMAGVKEPFNIASVEYVHDINIRQPGQPLGVQGPDRGVLIANADGDKLFLSLEFKTEGAKGKIGAQQETRDDRLFGGEEVDQRKGIEDFESFFIAGNVEHPGRRNEPRNLGTTLAYTIEGKGAEIHTTDFDKIILLRDQGHPERTIPEDFLSRIGIVAGKRSSITIAKRRSKSGQNAPSGEYVRITVPVDTRLLGEIIDKMLRDPSWQ